MASSWGVVQTGFLLPSGTEGAEQAFEEMAPEILAAAQANAPWGDRTGSARAGLGVEVTASWGEIELSLYHTVEYGLWLEVIQNGRFATIMPTLEAYASELFNRAGGRMMSTDGGG